MPTAAYYIENEVIVTVPVWDHAEEGGSNGWYHIVGFTGFQITACHGGKDIEGVWRVPFFTGPTTTTPGFAGAPWRCSWSTDRRGVAASR